ncbi:hypothetical protein NLG97_g10155 [Lecanicillium saksenae]|uniref:Uncharacterized protein n=1 Tax=Lecanicillium saksenae TaxID=468837 RepID=A0ACC1QFB0_9HYPO|nr:hypothetical protein NLG97_g10155 [Lecanicillium saksenae]
MPSCSVATLPVQTTSRLSLTRHLIRLARLGPAAPLLEQRRAVQHRIIVARDELVRHVRAVVKSEPRPAVRRVVLVQPKPLVRLGLLGALAQAVVVAGRAVGDVPRRRRVVQLVGVDDAVVERRRALVKVRVPGDVQVHAVL